MNVVEKVLRGVDGWQQRHKPAAFVFGVAKKYGDDNAGQLAGSLTYTGFVTLFPLLLVLTTVLGLVAAADPGLRHSVSDAVAGQFPLIGKQLTGNVGALRRSSLIGRRCLIGLSSDLFAGPPRDLLGGGRRGGCWLAGRCPGRCGLSGGHLVGRCVGGRCLAGWRLGRWRSVGGWLPCGLLCGGTPGSRRGGGRGPAGRLIRGGGGRRRRSTR